MRVFGALMEWIRGSIDQPPPVESLSRSLEPEVAVAEPEVAVAEPEVDQELARVTERIEQELETTPEPELIEAGRAWIADCEWPDLPPEDIPGLTDAEVLCGIERHYDGGLEAFTEDGYTVVEAPLSFPTDEDGFPTEHVTFQSHTLPDNTYSWVCGKSGCYNGVPEYGTRDESLAGGHAHEIAHGYVRELETPELEPDTPELEPEVAEAELEPDTPELEPDTPELEPEVAEAELEPEVAALDFGAVTSDGDHEAAPPSSAKDQLTRAWVAELREGGHRQAHGVWENHGIFGGKTECTMQVAVNTFGKSLDDLRGIYGDPLVRNVLYRNDVERQSYEKIAERIEEELGR